MPTPGEHKTVQARILEYAEAIGWTRVSREEAERRQEERLRERFDGDGDGKLDPDEQAALEAERKRLLAVRETQAAAALARYGNEGRLEQAGRERMVGEAVGKLADVLGTAPRRLDLVEEQMAGKETVHPLPPCVLTFDLNSGWKVGDLNG